MHNNYLSLYQNLKNKNSQDWEFNKRNLLTIVLRTFLTMYKGKKWSLLLGVTFSRRLETAPYDEAA